MVRKLTEKHPVTLVNSVNPYRIEGQKTAAFEIIDVLGDAPGLSFHPGGQRRQHHRLLERLCRIPQAGQIDKSPKMMGFQAEGAAPIVRGHLIEQPETIATAITIGNPASWQKAVRPGMSPAASSTWSATMKFWPPII